MTNHRVTPLISIVLPTYNGEKYIRQSIDSCLNQTYNKIELIIVDDASIDNTAKIIGSYKDTRIKYIKHEKNKRLPEALNTGFAMASGEYLTWTSDDNYYSNEALEAMMTFMIKQNCQFVFCDYYVFSDNDPNRKALVRLPDKPNLSRKNDIGACFLYSKNVKETIGQYNPVTFLAEDYDYWIRVSKQFALCHLNKPLYYYRTHAGSLARSYFLEVHISSVLVRMMHHLINTNDALDILLKSTVVIVQDELRGNSKFGKFLYATMNNVILNLFDNTLDILLKRRLTEALTAFQSKKQNLSQTKALLLNILMKKYGVLRKIVTK